MNVEVLHQRIPHPRRLARERQRQPGLFSSGPDPERGRQGHRANYWLCTYTPEIGEAHRNGDMHIHDLDMLSGYCAGWSLRTLFNEGLNGVPGKVEAGRPSTRVPPWGRSSTLGTLQNRWAGAQAFSSFDTYMAPYVRVDAMDYASVRQCIGAGLQPQRAVALGHADAVYQPHLRLDLPRRLAGAGAGDCGQRDAV